MLKRVLIALLLTAGLGLVFADAPRLHSQPVSVGVTMQGHVAPACSYPLPVGSDTVAAAYGFRKLRSAYAGSALQMYRESNGGTQDIGFAANGCDFDTTTAATFCASTICHVAKWYDQSGNSVTATGVIGTIRGGTYTVSCTPNSTPCAVSSVASQYDYYTGTLSGVTSSTIVTVVQFSDLTGHTYQVGGTQVSSPVFGRGYISTNTTPQCASWRQQDGQEDYATIACAISTWYSIIGTATNTLDRVILNGTQGTDVSTTVTLPSKTNMYLLGEGTGSFAGKFVEFILFSPSVSDADAKTVCANQGTYYGITTTC